MEFEIVFYAQVCMILRKVLLRQIEAIKARTFLASCLDSARLSYRNGCVYSLRWYMYIRCFTLACVYSFQPAEKAAVSSYKEKRKKEVEEKLQVLNAKKHNLVLVLKQVIIFLIYFGFLYGKWI